MVINGIHVRGVGADQQTRCKHYHGERDIIAIKFNCCTTYYCCYKCHRELAGHPAQVWKEQQFGEKAVLCGSCGTELSIEEYLQCEYTCPSCNAGFNQGCEKHYHLYFEK
jgi:uncharacterized CHY-type Zn-finger protein